MEENNKNSVGKVILVIILLILFLVAGFFGGKYYASDKKVESKEVKEEKTEEKEQELDINSRLVQYLYNMVTADAEESCFTGWEYKSNISNSDREKDYIHDNSNTTDIDLILTGKNLNMMPKYNVDISQVPTISGKYKSKDYNSTSGASYYYTKKDVETVYKMIFGSDAKLDTSKPIIMTLFGIETLYYDSASDRYYPQYVEGGGTCGPDGTSYKLSSAIKDGNKIKIYQNAEDSISDAGNNKQVEKYKYVYTFELEDDGMYKFVSRVKEK